jgi:hypothetical protein
MYTTAIRNLLREAFRPSDMRAGMAGRWQKFGVSDDAVWRVMRKQMDKTIRQNDKTAGEDCEKKPLA